MFLSFLLEPISLDDYAKRFHWLDFSQTEQTLKVIANNMIKISK